MYLIYRKKLKQENLVACEKSPILHANMRKVKAEKINITRIANEKR